MRNQQDQFKIDELGNGGRRKKVSSLHEQGTRGGLILSKGCGVSFGILPYTYTEHCGGLCSVSGWSLRPSRSGSFSSLRSSRP